MAIVSSTAFCHWKAVCCQTFCRYFKCRNERVTLVVFDWSIIVMYCVLVYTPPSIHIWCPDFPVYTVLFWSPAIEQSILQPLLMMPAALTNISHHTLITPIILNNTPILIHINGDNKSASNNRMLSAAK